VPLRIRRDPGGKGCVWEIKLDLVGDQQWCKLRCQWVAVELFASSAEIAIIKSTVRMIVVHFSPLAL
jgi:hypothetical protein